MSFCDILAFQEYIPEGKKWIEWWNGKNTDYSCTVITPKVWNANKYPNYISPIIGVNEEIMDGY